MHGLATLFSWSWNHADYSIFLWWFLCLCLDVSVMGSGELLGTETTVAIITLYKDGHKCKDIVACVEIRVQQVEKRTTRFLNGGGNAIPIPKPHSGWPRNTSNHISKVIRRQLDKNPTLTTQNLRENNCTVAACVCKIYL